MNNGCPWPACQADDTSDAISIIEITRDRRHRVRQTAAIPSSLTCTCRRHAIDPQHYLTQLLTNLPTTTTSQIYQWLPDEWRRRNVKPTG
jgi:two-component sensor histidine kinase